MKLIGTSKSYSDAEMAEWLAARLKGYSKTQRIQAQTDHKALNLHDWRAIRTIEEEFGSLWGKDSEERSRRERVIQRLLRDQPKVRRFGMDYDAPYSYGLHLAALRRDREKNPGAYSEELFA